MIKKHQLSNVKFDFKALFSDADKKNDNRDGIILVKPNKQDEMPIVRSTSSINEPSYCFTKDCDNLIEIIKSALNNNDLEFNNILAERYNSKYKKMNFHTDCACDLDQNKNSLIVIFSAYSDPETKTTRTLQIKHKKTGALYETELKHNSIVCFSANDNQEYLHRIMLNEKMNNDNVIWYGLTLRLSKTFIKFTNDNVAMFADTETKIVHIDKKCENATKFYKLKSLENATCENPWPTDFIYTLSRCDVVRPVNIL